MIAVELDPPFNQDAQKLMEGAFQLKQSGVDIITIADSPLARAAQILYCWLQKSVLWWIFR